MKLHYDAMKEIMGEDSIITRLGGDNFVGICQISKLKYVQEFLHFTNVQFDDNSVSIQTRAGIFCIPDDFEVKSPGDILAKIINAYTFAREGEKNTIVLYDEAMLQKRQKSLMIQQLLPDALKMREFEAYYQPKVNIFTGKLVGAEALCRWFHGGKMVFPDDFIPMLEETSDICRLDFYILERVCEDMRRWIDEGRQVVRTSVNFSRKHIMNLGLPDVIEEIVDRYEIPHNYIEIELTETTTDVEFGDLKRITCRLRELGFCITVDDFGSGFSSLNLIKEIPLNVLKIDRSLVPVDTFKEDSSQMIMFKYVVSMARELGLECVAEGVETKEQLKLLKANKCELVQGYYFDKPLPIKDFEQRLIKGEYDI